MPSGKKRKRHKMATHKLAPSPRALLSTPSYSPFITAAASDQ